MSAEPTWRCFVAVPIGEALRAALGEMIETWRGQPPADALRWIDPANAHLTLAFLGATAPADVPRIAASVERAVRPHAPVTLRTHRLGAFPRSGSARVLWHAVADPDGRCAALAADLAAELALPLDEPFRPHVTLARARRRAVDLRGWIEAASQAAPQGSLTIDAVRLMRSHLGTGPARYETLATMPLGASDR